MNNNELFGLYSISMAKSDSARCVQSFWDNNYSRYPKPNTVPSIFLAALTTLPILTTTQFV